MSLLLLFAGAGVQAPPPPASGPICGVISTQARPIGSISRTKTVGVVNADILDGAIMIAVRPSGSVNPNTRPVGAVSEVPTGTISQQSRPSGVVSQQPKPSGEVEMCED